MCGRVGSVLINSVIGSRYLVDSGQYVENDDYRVNTDTALQTRFSASANGLVQGQQELRTDPNRTARSQV